MGLSHRELSAPETLVTAEGVRLSTSNEHIGIHVLQMRKNRKNNTVSLYAFIVYRNQRLSC